MKLQNLRDRFDLLSAREKQVMHLVCSGLMNKQTAGIVGISEITVKVHRHNVMKKMGAKSLPDLVRIADLLGEVHHNASSTKPVVRSKPTTNSMTRSQVNGREYSVTII